MAKHNVSDDEFGFSPDVGKYVRRGRRMHTEYGHIYEAHEQTMIRSMPVVPGSHENYAEWTDEQRAHALAVVERSSEEHEKAEAAERSARLKLVEQAKAKLTEEEYEAIVDTAVREERGY